MKEKYILKYRYLKYKIWVQAIKGDDKNEKNN